MEKNFTRNENAVSPVLGAVLILAIGVSILTTVQLNFVPVWNAQEELDHLKKMLDDFKELKSGIESSIQSGTTLSLPLSMGFKYSPKMFVYNPRESAYASLDIQENTWAEVRYNEMFPEGMTDDTSIKNISTSTITYTLKGAQNYNAFIYEHGMIRRNGSNYTASSQTALANGTIYLLSVKPLGSETTAGMEKRTVNIYPTSQQKNSILGKNVWLILHTKPEPKYVNWWKSSLKKEGGDVRLANDSSGNIISYIDSSVIKMGEAYISTASMAAPAHAIPYRVVKVTPDNTNLPVDGIINLVAEVQDYYNNPVPNLLVSFSINDSRKPGNANATATLLQNSAVSGADGRASVMLKTSGAGFYYIDASASGNTTTFAYPASSQGGVISLSYTGTGPVYPVMTTLKDALGNNVPDGTRVDFDTNDGNVSPAWDPTTGGNASSVLNITSASRIWITNIQTSGTTSTSSDIAWETINNITVTAKSGYLFNSIKVPSRINSTGCVRYGTSRGNYPSIECNATSVSSHYISLSNLVPYTAYYFVVNSSFGGVNVNSTEYMFVTDAETVPTPPASVTNLTNVSFAPLHINWTWTDPIDVDFDHVEIYIDGVFKGNVNKDVQYYNYSNFRPNSSHTISTLTVDTANNKNATMVEHNATTASVFTYVFDFLPNMGNVTGSSSAQNDSDGGASAMLTEGPFNTIEVKYNWSFTPPIINNDSWVFGYTTSGASLSVRAGNNSTDGSPPGSLYANVTASTNQDRLTNASWRSPNFTWNNGTPLSAILNFSFRVATLTGGGSTAASEVFLIDPDGIKKQINQTASYSTTTNWASYYNNSVSAINFNKSGNYSLLLNATLFTTNNGARVEVRWDNPNLTLTYNTYSMNLTANTTSIPNATNQVLQIRYNVSGENFTLQVRNASAWNRSISLNAPAMTQLEIPLSPDELFSDGTIPGNQTALDKYYVLVRYLDDDPNSIQQGRLYLDYQRVYSS